VLHNEECVFVCVCVALLAGQGVGIFAAAEKRDQTKIMTCRIELT
jgi:hypothetical protein